MSARLNKQQINEYKQQLMSRFIELQRDLEQEDELLSYRGSSDIDSELEGCINLLFDLNYADLAGVSSSSRYC
ncbi:MAG: hypothetical protein ACU85E_10995 [Gammaproteobacteria bacterium]